MFIEDKSVSLIGDCSDSSLMDKPPLEFREVFCCYKLLFNGGESGYMLFYAKDKLLTKVK